LDFSTAGAVAFEQLADLYISLKGDSSPSNYTNYLTTDDAQLQVLFLNRLAKRSSDVTVKIMERIDADLNVTGQKNAEIG
jgi:hypothetical protein